ncbi:hypothetical protein [Liberiplasma polymorphum]|uniref:hypothetical protein n=1 Tax=Liberiplasma polymorphum TaxID=3374570 RepID=UPI0037761B99
MKKVLLITLMIFFSLLLSSCDYPEKSFQALRRDYIPKEVTRNFQLERGVYAPFVWTSDNDALVINGNDVIVHQKDEDVIVNITATINKKSETFEIKVLKIGSPLSGREKAEDITIYLNDTYKKIDGGLLELPNEINGIYIKYHLDLIQSLYGYKIENDKTYLSSSFRAGGQSISISMSFYDDIDMKSENHVYWSSLSLIAESLNEDDPFLLAVHEININNYNFTSNLKYQFGIANLKVGDIIAFGTSDSFEADLIMNNREYFNKIETNKFEITNNFRENTHELGRLTITIDGLSKTIFIQMYM